MKKIVAIIISLILSIVAILILACLIFYNINLKAVSSKSVEVDFMVDSGSTYYGVISKLKDEGLIRNELCFKLYIKFNKVNNIEAGTYILNKNMSVSEIVEVFSKGNTYNPDAIVITFKEGKHMRSIANTISQYTNNTEDEVYNLLKNTDYLNKLINEYWFIDEKILNTNIYYSLEGYLYPNTYEFKNKDVSIEEIFKTMLDEMDKKLSTYKTDILSNKYSIHELLTLASIVELEGSNSNDRAGIAGVFYNRLNSNMQLGSDVTTYYAFGIDMDERDLKASEINTYNPYNTRGPKMEGKIPVGPVSMPSIGSIDASINYRENDYLYFVADKNRKVYFTKTLKEHNAKIKELKDKGVWIEW